MSEPVHILHLEGDLRYAALVRETLERDGLSFTIRLAPARQEFEQLVDAQWDLVLADYAKAGFDCATVLQLFRSKHADVPFIFVSATMGEEVAVRCLKEGATDCVLRRLLAAGAVAYLTKPLDIAVLLRVLDEQLAEWGTRACGIRHLRDERVRQLRRRGFAEGA